MFSGCSSLSSIDITNFNISSVKRTGHMFENCTSLTELNLTNFAENVIDNMDYGLYVCII